MTNAEIARRLQTFARELGQKHDNLYRIRAYRRAAFVILGLDQPVAELKNWELEAVPGIGRHLAASIAHYAATGDWKTHEALTATDLGIAQKTRPARPGSYGRSWSRPGRLSGTSTGPEAMGQAS